MANQIEFKLKTSADLQGVKQLKKELVEVRNIANEGVSGKGIFGASEIDEIQSVIKAADTLEHALQSAYDPKINTVNINKFNELVAKSGMNVSQLSQKLLEAGPAGQKAFLTMTNSLMNMGSAVKQTNKVVEQIGTTFKNTIKWGISSGLWNTMLSATKQAYGYVKSLDSSLNNIRIVTGMSADEMERFGVSANKAAKDLAVSTKDFTEGALIYFQQGLDEDTSTKLAEITAKAANVTGQSMAQVSEELTAVWNGYGVAAENAERSVDSLAAIAAHSASNLQELSVGMSKVASAAAAMGVGEDQLASQISTIISITRQAPESVGTALKTIYARMSSIQAGAEEEGVNLMKYTKTMAEMGVNVLDANNKLRDMGDVIEEIGAKWQTMSREQQVALAQTMAGTRQYNNLIALFDNFDQYNEMMKVSANSAGTLQQQQETYLESINAKYKQLGAAAEELYNNLFNTDTIKGTLEAITGAVNVLADFTDAIGGLDSIIPMLGVLGLRVFKDQIGQSISQSVSNISNMNAQLEIQKQNELELERIFEDRANQSSMEKMPSLATNQLEEAKKLYSDINSLSISLNENQKQQFNIIKEGLIDTGKLAIDYKDIAIDVQEIGNSYQKILTPLDLEISKEKDVKSQLEDIDSEINKITENMQKISTISKGLDGLGFVSTDTSKILKNYDEEQSFKNFNIAKGLEDNGATDETIKKIQELEQKMSQAAIEGKNLGEVYNKDIVKNLNKANTEFFENEEAVESLEETLNNYRNILMTVQKNSNDFGEALRSTNIEALQDDAVINKLTQQYRELAIQQKDNDTITKLIKKSLDEYNIKGKEAEEVLRRLREQLANVSQEGENFRNTLELQDLSTGIVNVARSMGQLVMAWSQIKNLGSIWSDEDATTGEKIEKTIMALSMAIPMLVSGYKILTSEEMKNIAARIANFMATTKLAKAKMANAGATVAESGATKELTRSQWLLNAAMEANPIGLIIAGITALITYLTIVDNLNKKVQQGIIDNAEKNIKKHEENKEVINKEIEATNTLSSTLDTLNQKYKEGKISLSEYRKEMAKAYREAGDFDSAAEALGLDEEGQQKLVNDKKIEDNNKLIEENKAEIDNLKEKSSAQVRKENVASTRNFDNDTYRKLNAGGIDVKTIDAEQDLYEVDIENLIESYAKNPERFEEIMNSLHEADRKKIEAILNASQDSIDEIKTLIGENQEKILENLSTQVENNDFEGFDLDNISDVEEYNKVLYELSKRAYFDSDAFNSLAEAQEWAAKTLGKYNDKLSDYGIKEKQIDKIAKDQSEKLVQGLGEPDEHYQQRVEKRYQELKEKLTKEFENLSADEIVHMPVGFDYTEASEEELQEAISEAQRQADIERAQVILPTVQGAVNSLSSGKELDKETLTNLKEQISSVDALQQEYKELEMIRDTGSQDYLYKLIEIQEKLERIKTAAAAEDFSSYLDSSELNKIDVDADTEKFENTIEELMNKDYSVSVAVEADLQSDFDGVVNQLEDIDKYAGMIGENFIIAAKDIEEVNDAFPGILENAKILEDGSIQIEQGIAEAAIHSSEEAAKASAEEVAQRLEHEADLLEQKANIYGQMAQISFEEAKNEGDHSNAVTQLKAKNDELEGLNNQEVSNTEIDNAKNVADNAQQNAAATAKSWVSAYQAASDAAIAYGANAAAAYQAALTGVAPTGQEVPNTFDGGSSGVSQTATQANVNVDTLDSSAAFQEAGEKYARMQKQYLQMANNAKGKAMETRARGTTTQKGLDNTKSGKGSGKSGSGSSGGSSKEKKDPQKSELDAYKQLERAVDSLESKLKRLQDRQEHLNGKALIKNIDAQTKAYQKQAAVLQKLYIASEKQVDLYKDKLADKGFNVKYDSTGNITQGSYEKAYNKELKRYNAAIDAYNASSKDKAADDALKVAKDRYDQFKEYIDKYNEAISKTEQLREQMLESIQNVADSVLKKFDVKFDADLDTKKAEKSWLEFQHKISKDFRKVAKYNADDVKKIFDSAKISAGMFDTENNRFKDIQSQYPKMLEVFKQNGIKDGIVPADKVEAVTKALQKQGIQYTTVADLQKDLQESFKELQEYAEEVFDALQEGWDTYIGTIDEVISVMEELNQKYDKVANRNEYLLKVAELTSGVYNKNVSELENYEKAQATYYNNQIKTNQAKIDGLKAETEFYSRQLKQIQDMREAEAGRVLTQRELMQYEDYKKIANAMQEANEEIQDTTLQILEDGKSRKELYQVQYYRDLESALAGTYGTLEKEKQAWDDAMKAQDRYYDSTEKLYQLEALGNKYDSAINKDGISVKNQEKLNKLKEKELAYLKEQTKLTKDDIALAEQRYNIAVAEAALEDAQNSKNTMKVTRNEEGNWSYQYVADEDDVEDKRQNLLNEYNNLYEMAKEAYQNALELALEAKEEYLKRFKEIMDDTSLTYEEKQTAIQELNKNYADMLGEYYEEAQRFQVDMAAGSTMIIKDYYDTNVNDLANATEDIKLLYQEGCQAGIDGLDGVRDKALDANSELTAAASRFFEDNVAGWSNVGDVSERVTTAIEQKGQETYNNLISAHTEYENLAIQTAEKVGEDWSNTSKLIEENTDNVNGITEEIVDYGDESAQALDQQRSDLQDLAELWENVQDAINQCKEALDEMSKAAEEGIQDIARAQQEAQDSVNNAAAGSGASSSGSGGSSGNSTTTSASGPKATQSATHNGQWQVTYDYGNNKKETKTYTNYTKQQEDMKKKNAHYKTGGYTGTWTNGSDEENGRMAMLHQKELILNEKDTSNFLDAINVVRDLSSLSSSITDVITDKIAQMIANMVGMNIAKVSNNNTNNNDNNSTVYNINAEFPNATDKDSIMDAFISLPNIASQRANNKLR